MSTASIEASYKPADRNAEEGLTVGLIDSIGTLSDALRPRVIRGPVEVEALKNLASKRSFLELLTFADWIMKNPNEDGSGDWPSTEGADDRIPLCPPYRTIREVEAAKRSRNVQKAYILESLVRHGAIEKADAAPYYAVNGIDLAYTEETLKAFDIKYRIEMMDVSDGRICKLYFV